MMKSIGRNVDAFFVYYDLRPEIFSFGVVHRRGYIMSTELLTQIKKDRLLATKNGNDKLKTYLGVLVGEIDRSRGTTELDDTVVAQCIKKMRSAAKENLGYPSSDTAEFQFQLDVLNGYIKEETVLSEEDTRILIDALIADGANTVGMVMKGINGTSVDKAIASSIAKEILPQQKKK
jgi:hypothetical protein